MTFRTWNASEIRLCDLRKFHWVNYFYQINQFQWTHERKAGWG